MNPRSHHQTLDIPGVHPQLKVVTYPHPALRHKSKAIKRVDKELKNLVSEMFELMYQHKGIGLAANQVNLPFQLFIINPEGERGSGEERVLINPIIQSPKSRAEAEEGCLSLPSLYGQVVRPAQVHVLAYDLAGDKFDRVVDGLLARVIQHEFDHTQGVLFPDRMSEATRKALQEDLEAFEIEYQFQLRSDHSLDPAVIASHLRALEQTYC